MTQDLLPYYSEELTFLRSMAAGFARRHERVASRLWVEAGESVDPHVERLLQGVAFLNARVRHKLDDDFPELAQAMLGVIYPHYLRPIPSMGIVELQLHPTNVDFPSGYAVPAGTIVDTDPEPESGVRCRYRTGYPVTLWPLDVGVCELRRRPFQAPRRAAADKAESMLRIRLRAISKAMPIRALELGTLRFYLHAGPATNVYRLYELLFTKTLEICLAAGDGTQDAAPLGPGALRGVGFLRSEGLLPWDDRSFLGYRLLSEYFAFPQKFLFVDLELHAARKVLAACAESLDIYFFLDTADENLQRHVSSATFRLGATPIINLFDKKAEPFTLDQRRSEYLVEPDARNVAGHEIYSIDRVEVTAPDGDVTAYQPFYSFKHGSRRELARTFWHAVWRPSARASTPTREDRGRDVYLAFLDLDLNPASPANGTVRIMTTCLNRDIPSRFPATLGRLGFDLPEGRGAVGSVLGLSPPSATLRPTLGHGMIWRLISHLTLNHLSLTGGEEGAAALREILLLYDFRGSAATRSAIHGIQSVQSHRVTRRIGLHLGGFGRGIQIRLMLDETKFSDGGAYLMAALLERFLALYANINSFTETQVQCEQRVNQEEPWTWPMRSGEQILL